MKKATIAFIVIALATSCKKDISAKEAKTATVYIQIEAVDNDNITTTVSPIATVTVKTN